MDVPISITMFPALNGDSFLISYDTKHILVDCGYVNTYHDYLKETLSDINKRKEKIKRLIVTHIDADHIAGAVELLAENVVEIEQIWHNSYRHLQFDKIPNGIATSNGELVIKSILSRGLKKTEKKINIMKEISARQGTSLGSLILKGKYNWNSDFKDKAVSIENNSTIRLDKDAVIKLLSPDRTKLEKLALLWVEELKKLGIKHKLDDSEILDDAFEYLVSHERFKMSKARKEIVSLKPSIEDLLKVNFEEDKKVTNGSSIAFVLEVGNKKLLFLGDSHPGIIEDSLKNTYGQLVPILFDLIKVSHHGAFNNTSPSILKIIDSPVFLFSTNGSSHSHPDKETIAHIITRDCKWKRTLVFNYRTNNSEYFNNEDLMKKYNYTIMYADINCPLKITI